MNDMNDFEMFVACLRAASEGVSMDIADPLLPDFGTMSDRQISRWIQDGQHLQRSILVAVYFLELRCDI